MFSPLLIIYYLFFTFLAWKRLNWAVLLIIATLPSYLIRFRIGAIPMTLLEGMLIIVFIAAAGHRIKKVRATPRVDGHIYKTLISETFYYPLRRALTAPIGLFLIAATISLFIAPDLRAAAGIWKAYFIEPVLFFLVLLDLLIHHPTLLHRRQIMVALSVSALLLSLYAIYQRFTGLGIPPPWDKELRVTSIFPYPNALGLFLAPLIPLFIGMIYGGSAPRAPKAEPRRIQFLLIRYWILVIIATLMAIIFAKSTGALVGIGTGLFVLAILRLPRPAKAGLATTAVAVLVVATVLASPSLNDELLLRNWSGHVRRTQWAETIAMLKDRPILGAGLAGYKETLAPYHQARYLEIFEYPHNIVLNFWSETGVLGLISFIWLIILFFRITYKNYILHSTLYVLASAAAMITLLVHGLVDVPYFKNDLAILFWIMYALGVTNNEKPYATSHQTVQIN